MQKEIKRKNLLSTNNAKTIKGEKLGYLTYILILLITFPLFNIAQTKKTKSLKISDNDFKNSLFNYCKNKRIELDKNLVVDTKFKLDTFCLLGEFTNYSNEVWQNAWNPQTKMFMPLIYGNKVWYVMEKNKLTNFKVYFLKLSYYSTSLPYYKNKKIGDEFIIIYDGFHWQWLFTDGYWFQMYGRHSDILNYNNLCGVNVRLINDEKDIENITINDSCKLALKKFVLNKNMIYFYFYTDKEMKIINQVFKETSLKIKPISSEKVGMDSKIVEENKTIKTDSTNKIGIFSNDSIKKNFHKSLESFNDSIENQRKIKQEEEIDNRQTPKIVVKEKNHYVRFLLYCFISIAGFLYLYKT